MAIARGINLVMRVLAELAALAAFALYGFSEHAAFGVLAPLLAGAAWARYVAPRSETRLDDPQRLAVELAFFGLATAALASVADPAWAIGFAVVAFGSALLLRPLGGEPELVG